MFPELSAIFLCQRAHCFTSLVKGVGGFGRARDKGKERLQGDHCFLHFLRSDYRALILSPFPFERLPHRLVDRIHPEILPTLDKLNENA